VVSPVATAYTRYSVASESVTDVVEANPTKVLTPSTSSPQASADSRMRITFVGLNPTPVNCNEHVSVNVHSVAPVNGPEIWNGPMSKT
jgi:hypothetical protein